MAVNKAMGKKVVKDNADLHCDVKRRELYGSEDKRSTSSDHRSERAICLRHIGNGVDCKHSRLV